MDARRHAGFVACLLAAASCGCEGQPPGALAVEARRLPILEAGSVPGGREDAAGPDVHPRIRGFEVVGGNAYARAIVEMGAPALADGWHGQVHVADDCEREDCLHWIAGSEATRRLLFPGAQDVGYRPVQRERDGYLGREVSATMSLDHVRDGIRLRSVIEVRASPRERPSDTREAWDEPPSMGRTTIDLDLGTMAYTAPAAGFDLQEMALVAAGFGIGRQRQRLDPGPRVDCDPSLGATDPACESVMGWISGKDAPMSELLPADGDW